MRAQTQTGKTTHMDTQEGRRQMNQCERVSERAATSETNNLISLDTQCYHLMIRPLFLYHLIVTGSGSGKQQGGPQVHK